MTPSSSSTCSTAPNAAPTSPTPASPSSKRNPAPRQWIDAGSTVRTVSPMARTVDPASSPVLRDLLPEKSHAFPQLLHPIDPILNADPALKPHALQLRKDRVVIIEPLANHPVPQPLRIAHRVHLLAPQILNRPLSQIPVARVHRQHPCLHPPQQLQWIL